MITKTLANTVIRNTDGLEGFITTWNDTHTAALVFWDGWMGTEWVKAHEMTVVWDVVGAVLQEARKNESQCLGMAKGSEGDHLGRYSEKYYARRIAAVDMALAALGK